MLRELRRGIEFMSFGRIINNIRIISIEVLIFGFTKIY